VPALPDAECSVACNPRRLKCPAPGTSAPHSTRRRVGMFVRAVDEMLDLFTAPLMPLMETNPPRRGGPPRPPAGFDFALALSRVVLSFIDVYAALAG